MTYDCVGIFCQLTMLVIPGMEISGTSESLCGSFGVFAVSTSGETLKCRKHDTAELWSKFDGKPSLTLFSQRSLHSLNSLSIVSKCAKEKTCRRRTQMKLTMGS